MPDVSLTFPAELSSVRSARRFLQSTLRAWRVDHYDLAAPMVLTELVTNAALHARTPFTVRLHRATAYLSIEVFDASPRVPQPRHYAADATTGRGMNLVESLSDSWGCRPSAGGKTVWAHVRPDDAAFADLVPDDEQDDEPDPSRQAAPSRQPPTAHHDDDIHCKAAA